MICRKTKIGDIAEVRTASRIHSVKGADSNNITGNFVKTSFIQGRDIDPLMGIKDILSEVYLDVHKTKFFSDKEILFSSKGSFKAAVFKEQDGNYIGSSSILVLSCIDGVLPEYLKAVMNSQGFQEKLAAYNIGSTIPNISISSLKQIEIDIPVNMEDQKKIADLSKLYAEDIILHKNKLQHIELQKNRVIETLLWSKKIPSNAQTEDG